MTESDKIYYLWCLGVSASELQRRFHMGATRFNKIINGRPRVQAELRDEDTLIHCFECEYAACYRPTGEWWCRRKDPHRLTEENGYCHRAKYKM